MASVDTTQHGYVIQSRSSESRDDYLWDNGRVSVLPALTQQCRVSLEVVLNYLRCGASQTYDVTEPRGEVDSRTGELRLVLELFTLSP